MTLRLEGHLSYIDKYHHLKFTSIDDATTQKLVNLKPDNAPLDYHTPFNGAEFSVSLPPPLARAAVPEDIRALIGLDCTLHVTAKPYSFISKLPSNKGEKVNGIKLVLVNIQKHEKYN